MLPRFTDGGGATTTASDRGTATDFADTADLVSAPTLGSWPKIETVGTDTAGSTAGVSVTKDTPGAGSDTIALSVTQSPDAKIGKHLAVHAKREQGQRVHGLVHAQAFHIGPVQHS